MFHRGLSLFAALAVLGSAACVVEPDTDSTALGEASLEARQVPADFEIVVPWGDGPAELGLRARREEFLGDGPSGIALGPSGETLVVDRLHGRVVRVGPAGVESLFPSAADVELLAVAEDGAALLFSPLRARAQVVDAAGKPLGEVAIPRAVGDVTALRLGSSRRVEIETAFQERFVAGSPHAPLAVASALRTKREGALDWGSGGSLHALVDASGDGHLVIMSEREGERAAEAGRVKVATGVRSLRVLGQDGGHVVTLAERVEQTERGLSVSRDILVVDPSAGALVGQWALPTAGLWVPRQAYAVGFGRVAFMDPLPDGMRVASRTIASLVVGGAK
ncbi:MAG: hypothetical protein IPM79_30745 [Polyangiaceae bacterium]|jgi:hypothetical protein|nr:hypothetical protein [Polyangiaceae bacterium]MBK8941864.1 hypothetical protein [Polyangiaceae bacterium]